MNNQDIKFVPMLFSTPMVQATMRGEKDQTRRVAIDDFDLRVKFKQKDIFSFSRSVNMAWIEQYEIKPKAKVGDIIWVRETFVNALPSLGVKYFYKADNVELGCVDKWRSSLFMPKSACRIFLKVTDVRVERLQDISEEDAIGEGILKVTSYDSGEGISNRQMYENYLPSGYTELLPIDSYSTLWESINGKVSWNKNPWVFVYKFDRLEGVPEGFLTPKNAKG